MWADSLLAAERSYLMRLLIWASVSVLTGTALMAWLRGTRRRSALLDQFAIQTILWGAVLVVRALTRVRSLAFRDLSGATQMDRLLWMNIGLDGGYILVGVTLLLFGWRAGPRPALIGAGLGVIVQGCALAVLDLDLASRISR